VTLNGIRKRVAAIEAMKGDDELAHGAEDDLREEFIRFIAAGPDRALGEMAAEVLKTEKISFFRWCA
jgi:hypothetical protein